MENTKGSLEAIFKELLSCSKELELLVQREDSEPEQWLEHLDLRAVLLQQIADGIGRGELLKDEWRDIYLAPFMESHERMSLAMKGRQDDISVKIAQLQRGKVMNQQYNGYGASAYGAFFDKKK